MATVSRADVAGVFNLMFMDDMSTQFRQDTTLLRLLEVEPGANENCTWKAKFNGRSAGGAFAEGADMADSDFDAHDRVRAALNWAEYRKGAKISGLATALAAASGYAGPNGIGLDMEEINDAIDSLAVDLAVDVYAGDPTASPVELAGAAIAVDSNTGVSFASIDPSTYGAWVGNEATLAQSAITESTLRTNLLSPVRADTGRNPDLVMCPLDLFDIAKDVAGESADTLVVRSPVGPVDLVRDMGCQVVVIDGVPFVYDQHCTASTFYALTLRDIHIKQVPAKLPSPQRLQEVMKALTGTEIPIPEIIGRIQQGQRRLQPSVEALAQTGDAYKFMVKVYLQLCWRRRNSHAKLTIT